MDIPIVIATYNRPHSLQRILASLNKVSYKSTVKLYISIDGGGDDETLKISNDFTWVHGTKEVIHHSENLGLRKHILSCGDLALQHDAIVLLEDDLYVSPVFYTYIEQAVDFYKNEKIIAGISLYSHNFNESAQFAFTPINDGFDLYFLQIASSWGQCWTNFQWRAFRDWYKNNENCQFSISAGLPLDVVNWPEKSWKKYYIKYMVENGLFFAYPRISFTTNFGDVGENHLGIDNFQVPLNYGKSTFNFPAFDESLSKYDCYCEILPGSINSYTNQLAGYSYTVDLYGIKPRKYIETDYLLTTRPTLKRIFSFGRKMVPHEANVIEGIKGDQITFSKIQDVEKNPVGYSIAQMLYFHRVPDWCKNKLRFSENNFTPLNSREKVLLKINSKRFGKIILIPIFGLYRIYTFLKDQQD